jgi:pimeloyl-ACP methyl ester carboxylesterase
VGAARVTGSWQELRFESEALRDNPLGDPAERPVYVWAPAGGGPYPVVYVLQGFMGLAPGWFNVRPWQPSFPEQVERLAPEAVVVLVDAFTALGGSQFVDSPAIGRYHTYLCDELVPWIDGQFPTGRRAVQGHSSGGYGAMVNAMLRPDLFSGFATHAGDALFENCYQHEFTEAVRALRDAYDGSYDRFWEDFRSEERPQSKKTDHVLLNVYAMAAAYSGGELPFDLETGELRDDVWRRWLDWDPVRMAREPRYAEALRRMQAIWIGAGKRDEFNLDLGAVAFHLAVADAGVDADVVHYELHDGGHFDTPRTTAAALTFLVERLA